MFVENPVSCVYLQRVKYGITKPNITLKEQ